MSIELIINGFFRSGTTFIWKYLKNELDEAGFISLYEPLHPELAILIAKEIKGFPDILHNDFLFLEYKKLKPEILKSLLLNHPNSKLDFLTPKDSDILDFLEIINKEEKPIFIQDNRLHFFLDSISKKYTNNIIHIIRNPYHVWHSIKNAYKYVRIKKEKNIFKKLKFFLLENIKIQEDFEIKKIFIG